MRKSQPIFLLAVLIGITFLWLVRNFIQTEQHPWKFRSIDTMKISRDLAREKLHDQSFDQTIEKQMTDIEKTGANYVAIDTPYDEEFQPILRRFINSARRHHLHIWFRGNFSGWEEWFGYAKIDKNTHLSLTRQFIVHNRDLFRNGDIFSSCPECENGLHPDLSKPEDLQSYKEFLLQEYAVTKNAFLSIHKDVASNYFSMNATIAEKIMDRETTQALGGIVVIDHYIASPDAYSADIKRIAAKSGGKIILGEFGAPIPDLHGPMTEEEQKEWLERTLTNLARLPEVTGVNYWVNKGGTTALWRQDDSPKPAVQVLTDFYTGKTVFSKEVAK